MFLRTMEYVGHNSRLTVCSCVIVSDLRAVHHLYLQVTCHLIHFTTESLVTFRLELFSSLLTLQGPHVGLPELGLPLYRLIPAYDI